MPDSPQPVPRHSTSPKTPASSPPLTADVKPSPSSKATSPTASPSLPNSWHNAQVIFTIFRLILNHPIHISILVSSMHFIKSILLRRRFPSHISTMDYDWLFDSHVSHSLIRVNNHLMQFLYTESVNSVFFSLQLRATIVLFRFLQSLFIAISFVFFLSSDSRFFSLIECV